MKRKPSPEVPCGEFLRYLALTSVKPHPNHGSRYDRDRGSDIDILRIQRCILEIAVESNRQLGVGLR